MPGVGGAGTPQGGRVSPSDLQTVLCGVMDRNATCSEFGIIMNSDASDKHVERLRTAGLKVTGPRLAILDAVERNRNHPSAEEIYHGLSQEHPSLSLSTVYGTLGAFVRAGLVRKLSEVDGRLRVDGTTMAHDHAICRSCGKIFDIERGVVSNAARPSQLPGGLAVLQVRVEYDVICRACRVAP